MLRHCTAARKTVRSARSWTRVLGVPASADDVTGLFFIQREPSPTRRCARPDIHGALVLAQVRPALAVQFFVHVSSAQRSTATT